MHIPHRRSWHAMPGLASSTQLPPSGTGLLQRLLRQLRLRALRWHRTHLAEAELAMMDDRMLADIGVSRCDLERRARLGRGA